MTCFDSNGSASDVGKQVYEIIDPVIGNLFRKLVAEGHGVNEVFSLVVLSASDARTEIVLARKYKVDGTGVSK